MLFENLRAEISDRAARLRAEERPFVIATVVAYKSPQSARPGSKALIEPPDLISGWIGGGCVQPLVIREARKALETGKPKLVSISPDEERGGWQGVETYQMSCQGGGSLEIYLEPVIPKPKLIIIGRSPVAQVLAGLGRLLDFKVSVADPEATPEQFPEADAVITDLGIARLSIDSQSFVVIATMGNGDEEGLESVAGTAPRYAGFIASPEKAVSLFQYLRDKGARAEDLNRIKCPAGLALGGETLPEIALSVMAEITSLRRAASKQSAESAASTKGKSLSLPVMQPAAASSRDPICGMSVEPAAAKYKSVVGERTIYFCCLRCKETFDRAPQDYLAE